MTILRLQKLEKNNHLSENFYGLPAVKYSKFTMSRVEAI
jgi:hypothetical protein